MCRKKRLKCACREAIRLPERSEPRRSRKGPRRAGIRRSATNAPVQGWAVPTPKLDVLTSTQDGAMEQKENEKKLFPILGRYNGELCRCAAFCANVRPFAEITIGRYARKLMDDMRDKNFEL